MAQVEDIVVAASVDNELSSKDFADIKKLKNAGHHIYLSYYLPKVPAEYTQLPDIPPRIARWHTEGHKLLQELGNKLEIPKEDQFFTDEILGPDEVFETARNLKASMILTNNPKELKQRFLSRVFDKLLGYKEVGVKRVATYVKKHIPQETVYGFKKKETYDHAANIPSEERKQYRTK